MGEVDDFINLLWGIKWVGALNSLYIYVGTYLFVDTIEPIVKKLGQLGLVGQ